MMFCIVLLYEEPSCCSLHSCFADTHPSLCKLSQSQRLASQRFPFRREEVKHYRQKGKAGSSEMMAARLYLHVWVLCCVRVSVCLVVGPIESNPYGFINVPWSEQAYLFISSAIRVCNILLNAYFPGKIMWF